MSGPSFIGGLKSTAGGTFGLLGTTAVVGIGTYKYFEREVTSKASQVWNFVMSDIGGYFSKGGFGSSAGNAAHQNAKEFVEALKLDDLADTISERLFKNVRKLTLGELDHVREDVQKIFSNIARDTTLKTIPWVALGIIMTAAAPVATYYSVRYIYDCLFYNIGKPKLAQERKNYNVIDRTTEVVSNVLSLGYQNTKTFFKWSVGTFGAVFLGSFFLGIPAEIAHEIGIANMEWFAKPSHDFFRCSMAHFESAFDSSSSSYTWGPDRKTKTEFFCDRSSEHFVSYNNVVLLSLALGLGAVAYQTLKSIYGYIHDNWGVIPKRPIFNETIQEAIDDVVNNTVNLHANGGYFQHLLLYGPGGTGKTMVSKYIARNAGMNYIMMSGGDLAQYIKRGEHVTELNKLFEEANNAHGETIIFIDEAESLCRDRRCMQRDELFELLNAFLNQTGVETNKFMLILATNRVEDLDEAVLSRMDNKLFIGPPEFKERKQILEMYLSQFFSRSDIDQFFNDEELERISKTIEGFTGRTIFKMVNAISSKQKSSVDNTLTEEMRDTVILRFVTQEKQVAEARDCPAA